MAETLFTGDYKSEPYWMEDVVPLQLGDNSLPDKADVVVIGSGYTGSHAALETARAGLHTVVIDSGNIGQGCSTRNGGQVSSSIKPDVDELTEKYGRDRAKAIRQEGENALNWIESFVQNEGIDCDFERNGLYYAAHTPRHYESLARDADILKHKEGIEAFAVPQQDQKTELGSDAYFGGLVFPRHAALHAAKYHSALAGKIADAGARLVSNCTAVSVDRGSESGDAKFTIKTTQGTITARHVMVATNGYTSSLIPWFQNRLIPIGSYVIATEPLPKEQMDALFPTGRVVCDTCKVIYYYRASPDRTRVLFGGRVSANETNPDISAPRLHKQMCRIFPGLKETKISHSWTGTVAYTFDSMAHTGTHDGMHYALGYCGSGISLSSYLGMRAGQKIVGKPEGASAFDDLPFPTRPLYRGKPWFLPAAVSLYALKDKMQITAANGFRQKT